MQQIFCELSSIILYCVTWLSSIYRQCQYYSREHFYTIKMAVALVAAGAGIVTIASFIGASIASYFFRPSVNEQSTSEMKNEIHVLSTDVKGMSVLEVISLVLLTVISITILAVASFVIYKYCKKHNKNSKNRNNNFEEIELETLG